jgi:hypothetical protein
VRETDACAVLLSMASSLRRFSGTLIYEGTSASSAIRQGENPIA